MIEVDSRAFLSAVTQLRTMIVLTNGEPNLDEQLYEPTKNDVFLPLVKKLIDAISALGGRSPLASARRLEQRLVNTSDILTYRHLNTALNDIESRLVDYVDDIRLFMVDEHESRLFEPAENLIVQTGSPLHGFAAAYPNACFEIEEAAKCIALGRFTASVFHSMRALECGIRAFAKLLSIPDPVKGADRNWSVMLRKINDELQSQYPSAQRLPGTKGAKLEGLYASLDAVRNPQRNATMHVESIYAPHEALHIARCGAYFMLGLFDHCDEEGNPV